MKRHLIAAILAATTLAGPCAFAQDAPHDNPPHGHGPHGHPVPPILRGVTLTDAQKTKLHDLMKASRPPNPGPHGPGARHELEALLLAPTLDEKAISAAEEKVAKENADHLHHMIEMQEKIRTILTPEQLTQARSHIDDHPHGPGHDHEPPPPPPPGAGDTPD